MINRVSSQSVWIKLGQRKLDRSLKAAQKPRLMRGIYEGSFSGLRYVQGHIIIIVTCKWWVLEKNEANQLPPKCACFH